MDEMIERLQLGGYPVRFDLVESRSFLDMADLRMDMDEQGIDYVHHKNIFLFASEHDLNVFKLLI